ncbi:MAG: extracellular solute-binding protein, partial [Lachnospiraceae bacterium]|nr:extracellular solute-binding protein [Lachnospiraceae bacterium]
MKMKKFLSLCLAATMTVGVLGGCGDGGSSGGSTGGNDGGNSSGGVEEITFMVWDDLDASSDLISQGYKQSIDRFNKDYEGKYHCKVVSTNLEEYYTKLNAEVAANNTPDVFIVSPGPNLDDYVLPGTAAKLDDYLNADGWKGTFTSDAV